ncbi:MAG: hypothetical protein NW207_04500 [Cytophagales bacterium]|nr:hypothetical protein [Cytophagales bacterium]
MKNILIIISLTISTFAIAQNKKAKVLAGYTVDNYEVACMGVGTDGSKLIKIWGYGPKPEKAVLQAKTNAVHAIIFKGVTAATDGCQGIKPLASSMSVEQEFQEYFNTFFQPGGAYLNYIALSGEGGDNQDVTKVDKKTYKVGIIVSVMFDALRSDLEKAGIVKGLNSGF